MLKIIVACTLVFTSFVLNAQNVTGIVRDSVSKHEIPLVSIFLVDYHMGMKCDSMGNFVFTGNFPEKIAAKVSAFGFETRFVELYSKEPNEIFLAPQHLHIEEIVVSGARNQLQRFNSSHIEVRAIKDLNTIPSTSLGQSIEAIPGVYNSSTGNGIAKPVIRGFQGARVLSLLNGVRIENQQWGGDHGMGLTDLGIEFVEVIKGPASLLYGADALGGVIYFVDESFASPKTHQLRLSSQFESNSAGTISSLFYKGVLKGLRINVGGRFNSQADYKLASSGFAKNSRYQERAGKLSLGWNKGRWISSLKYSYNYARVGIPGHTHDTIITTDLFVADQQTRAKTIPVQNFTNHILSFENKFLFQRNVVELLLGATRNELEEFEEKVTIPELEVDLNNVLYNFKVKTAFNARWTVVYGIQGMAQFQTNGLRAVSRLLPNATQFDNGVYGNVYLDLKRWRFQLGARSDLRNLSSESDSVFFQQSFEKNFGGYSFAHGGVWSKNKHIARYNISSGFRVPHLSELLSNGIHHGTLRYEIGNNQLAPEKAVQLDLTYEYGSDHLSIIINPFISSIADYITLNPQDSVIEGNPVFKYEQLKSAQLYGVDFGFHYHPHFLHALHIESSYSYLRGTSAGSDNLSLMPQPRISTSAIFRPNMKTKFRITEIVIQHSYFFPQNNVVVNERKSVDYSLLNFGVNFKTSGSSPLEIQLGARNVTNTRYINHLSRLKNIGLESPGLNFYLKLLLTINQYEKK